MLLFFLILIILTSFVLSIRNTVYGCSIFLISRILIPEFVRLTPWLDISLNTALIIIMALFCARDIVFKKKCLHSFLNDSYVRTLLFFAFFLLITVVGGECLSTSDQMKTLAQFFITDILPGIVFVCSIKDKKDVKIVMKVLAVASIINCSYGLLSFLSGSNPYLDYLRYLYDVEDTSLVQTLQVSRWSSATFINTNCWGYFLPIAFVLMFYFYKCTANRLYQVAYILISVGVLICGKRSAIISYVAFWILYYLLSSSKKKLRYTLVTIALIGVSLVLFYTIPVFNDIRAILESSLMFWDDSVSQSYDIEGSSMALRIRQVVYPWTEIKRNLLFGHGYGWCRAYLERYELHPIMFGFETIFATAVCEGGIFGVFIWIWIFFDSFRYSIKRANHLSFYIIFTAVQIVIAISTGMSYFFFYCVFIAILYKFTRFINPDENYSRNRNRKGRKVTARRRAVMR